MRFFVVGTAFGRITNLSLAAGVERNRRVEGVRKG